MINKTVDLESISFERVDVPKELLESIYKRGIAIPVRVNEIDTGYECIDGKKRLSACLILQEQDEKFKRVPVMIANNFSKAGSAFWGNTQNHH